MSPTPLYYVSGVKTFDIDGNAVKVDSAPKGESENPTPFEAVAPRNRGFD